MYRFAALAVLLSVIVAVLAAPALSRRAPSPMRVTLTELADGDWRLVYEPSAPVRRLDLGKSLGRFRTDNWRLEGAAARLVQVDGRDIVEPERRGARLERIVFHVAPAQINRARTYEAFNPGGRDGTVLYTGHFQPFGRNGARWPATFTVRPGPGRLVAAFGKTAPTLENWRSRFDHPAFIYIGRRPPFAAAGVVLAVDADAPAWIEEEMSVFAIDLLRAMEQAFGWSIDATPNFFLSYAAGGAPGQAIFAGDALPAQFRVALEGGAWENRTAFSERILRAGLAHEAAHFWQLAARPLSADTPDWIHEGGANALAAEVLVAMGVWSRVDVAADLQRARGACLAAVRGRSLARAEREGDYEASYACGQVLNVLAARGRAGGAVGFWNDLIAEARARGGYDDALFFELAARGLGDDVAAALERFVRANDLRPEEALAAIERAAG